MLPTRRTLLISGGVCVLGSMPIALFDSLIRNGWTVALEEAVAFGISYGAILWFLTLPGLTVYGAALRLWRHGCRWHRQLVALVLSPLIAALPVWAFTRAPWTVQEIVWAVCLPALAGFLVQPEHGELHYRP